MLVLSRKPGETITIGPHIKVSVLQIKGKQVRLGVEAPDDTRIHRQEVYLTLQGQDTAKPAHVKPSSPHGEPSPQPVSS